MTVTVDASVLRDLHRMHRQLADLNDRLERGPRQIKARQNNVAAVQAELAGVQDATKKAKVAADQKQLQLRSGEEKIKDLQTKLNAAASNREYQALVEQIAADEMAGSVLADEILEALEKIDELEASILEAQAKLETAKSGLAKVEQEVRETQGLIRADIQRLEEELKQTESSLPLEAREAYQRVARTQGEEAFAQVEGEICGGCNQKLTPNKISQLMMSHVVFCNVCGRFLYFPEDRAPGRK